MSMYLIRHQKLFPNIPPTKAVKSTEELLDKFIINIVKETDIRSIKSV